MVWRDASKIELPTYFCALYAHCGTFRFGEHFLSQYTFSFWSILFTGRFANNALFANINLHRKDRVNCINLSPVFLKLTLKRHI